MLATEADELYGEPDDRRHLELLGLRHLGPAHPRQDQETQNLKIIKFKGLMVVKGFCCFNLEQCEEHPGEEQHPPPEHRAEEEAEVEDHAHAQTEQHVPQLDAVVATELHALLGAYEEVA